MLVSAAVAANLLPAALLFCFVHRFGVDVPFWDEWQFVSLLQELDQGTLGFHTLFAQHNEHRPLFPRLLTLANAMLFHWNRTAEMYVTAVLLILCAWLLFRFVQRYWAHPLTPLLFLPIAWTLLSWRQWENLLWGFQTCFGLLAAGVVLAFCLLHRARRVDRFVSAAAAAAFVASYSLGGGLFIWPIGLAQILLQRKYGQRDDKPASSASLVWTGVGVLTWALYFFGYHQPSGRFPEGFTYLIHNPVPAAGFVAAMIGSPLSWYQPVAQSLGVAVTILVAWTLFRLRREPWELAAAAPLLSLLALTMVSVVACCDRRLGRGVQQALSSRYCSVTALGLVALFAMLTRLVLTRRRPADWLAWGGMAVLLTFGAMMSFLFPGNPPQWWLSRSDFAPFAARYAEVMSDEGLAQMNHDPSFVRQGIPFLRAHGYSVFYHPVPPGFPARCKGSVGGCNIEAVDGRRGSIIDVPRLDNGVRVEGWAVDLAGRRRASRLFVSIDGRTDVPALYGQTRLDVALFFRNPDYGTSGFIGFLRTSLFTDGEHVLQLKIVSNDGASYSTCGVAHIRVAE